MSEPFIAEIKMFGGNFAPRNFALCNGQTLAISQYAALFSLLGTTYGGNGTSNFQLPNMQGNVPLQPGQGAGLSTYVLGETTGTQNVTLLNTQIPGHTHVAQAAELTDGSTNNPTGQYPANSPNANVYTSSAANTTFSPAAISPAGGSLPHNNMQPFLVVTFIIALAGIYPSRG